MNLKIKTAIAFLLSFFMLQGNTSVLFAESVVNTSDKESKIVTPEDLEEIEQMRLEHRDKVKVKKESKSQSSNNKKESLSSRAAITEEVERNDTFRLADTLMLGERFKGYIDEEDDIDIFQIEFPSDGIATVELWSIPEDCDYDLFVYDEDKDEIDASCNGNDEDEVIEFDVMEGYTYYVKIESFDGYDDSDHYYVDADFEESNPYYCASVGVDFDPNFTDTSNDAKTFGRDMESIGYDTTIIRDVIYDNWTDNIGSGKQLLEADVLMLAGHGNSDGIYFNYLDNGGDYATGVVAGPSRSSYFKLNGQQSWTYNFAGLSDFDVEDTVLAVFAGCSTAKGGRTSLAHAAVFTHGIDCAIGWKEDIRDKDTEKWLDNFGMNLAEGETIRMAAYYANRLEDYEIEEEIVGSLDIVNEYDDAFDVSLADYASSGERRSNQGMLQDANEIDTVQRENLTKALLGDVSAERIREFREKKENLVEAPITETIYYSYDDENIDEIISYITRNIDENFDINNFEVKTNICNAICDGEVKSTSISMNLKKGDFVTNDGYYIGVTNGVVDVIIIDGDPDCTQVEATIQKRRGIDEEVLKEEALKEVTLFGGEEVTSQKVLKKYDTEPYYAVVTNIYNGENDMGRSEYYEYRL